MVKVTIDDRVHDARGNERLIDLLNRIGTKVAQVCYHPQLGPIQTCDTCLVETNGQLVRACGTDVSDGMTDRQNRRRPSKRNDRHSTESSVITCFTAPCATTTTATASPPHGKPVGH